MDQKYYLNEPNLAKHHCTEFFERIFHELHKELERLLETFHKNEKLKRYVFALNEATWVGLFNNAIIRSFGENVTTLQEMGIYEEKKFYGRVDFLVHWKSSENAEPIHFIFEAKQNEEQNSKTILNDSSAYLENIQKQGEGYYNANKLYYKNDRVFIVPIVWGWIRKKGLIEEALKYKGFKSEIDEHIDFCSLYYEGSNGVWVYGKVCDPQVK